MAFGIHSYFLKRGREEFDQPVSKGILWATLLVSLAQLAVVTVHIAGGMVL